MRFDGNRQNRIAGGGASKGGAAASKSDGASRAHASPAPRPVSGLAFSKNAPQNREAAHGIAPLSISIDALPCAADVSRLPSPGPSPVRGRRASTQARQATEAPRATQRDQLRRHTCLNGGCGHPFPSASCAGIMREAWDVGMNDFCRTGLRGAVLSPPLRGRVRNGSAKRMISP